MSALNGIVTRWPRSLQAEVVLVLAAVLLGFAAGVTGWEAFRALAFGALVLAMCCALWLCWRPVVEGLRETRSVPGGAAPELVALVARLAASAGLAPPRVRVVRAAQPNAHIRSLWEPPQITVTQGLLDRRTELERTGVLGHELGHISAGHDGFFRRRFLRASAVAVGAVVTTGALAAPWVGVLSVLWPAAACACAAAAWMLDAPANRRRELEADRLGARITGIEAPVAALDAAARERKTRVRNGRLRALLRLFDPYPTIAQRRAAIESEARSLASAGRDDERQDEACRRD
jgi:Zn-dependent protease with chaperone function